LPHVHQLANEEWQSRETLEPLLENCINALFVVQLLQHSAEEPISVSITIAVIKIEVIVIIIITTYMKRAQ
jgi:hypothetical protein